MVDKDWDWNQILIDRFYKKPGSHATCVGTTGTGKTQLLYFLVDGILAHGRGETIVWLDVGKGSEFLTLARFRPLKIILIEGTDVKINIWPDKKQYLHEIIKVHVRTYSDIWQAVDPNYINIISLQPFLITDIAEYTRMIGKIFKRLIKLATRGKLPIPITIVGDEFHLICPERNNQLSKSHYSNGAIVQMNVELLRTEAIRLIMGGQGMTKIRYGVRSAAQWRFAKRGCVFVDEDDGKLMDFNKKVFSKLKIHQFIVANPEKDFSNPIKLPFYGDGKAYGTVQYIGMLGKTEDDDDTVKVEDEKPIVPEKDPNDAPEITQANEAPEMIL